MMNSVIQVDSEELSLEDIRPSGAVVESSSFEESPHSIPHHPLGVRPAGNQYTATSIARNSIGSFQAVPDEIIAIILEVFESRDLRFLGSTCKFLYAFTQSDDFWKTIFIESPRSKSGLFQWRGTWRSTYLDLQKEQLSQVRCDNVFSDVLYRPFLCTHTPLTPYTVNIPRANAIARFDSLSPAEFSEKWSDKPFILTKVVREWPVYKTWDTDALLEQYKNVKFRAEAVDWTLSTYVDYMNNSSDESPLYLFDRGFVEKMNLSVGKDKPNPSYWIPECFGEDLFAVLGDKRPDDKWLIIGPARSGSTYHKDPNATSAWNAVLRGSKYWIMFPSTGPSPPPPGVYVSEDQSEVTSPLSIAEWLLGFHAEARKTPGCIEGVCNEGEVLHVPSGWWHLVVNLDASIAITQNFVPRSHLAGVMSFLKDKAGTDQISGFKQDVVDPYGLFIERMQVEHPELLELALAELEKKAEGKKRKWDAAVGKDEGETNGGGFSFSFGDDSDEEVP
ncbi:Clavaminate synthase-like protein [Acephala macrosclerotiorum]|nr:Clavaminate synthase-like protein [Acephala macrosclerotiorum]